MNTIVIYRSNTGFTKKYAKWIAKELFCEAIPAKLIKTVDLNHYDCIIFGGWLFAGSIQGLKEFKENIIGFKGKKAVFFIGAMATEASEVSKIKDVVFTEEERENIGLFYMQGGLDYSRMGFLHKGMMKMMCTMMKKEKGINSIEYQTISQSFDGTDKEAIKPLIDYMME